MNDRYERIRAALADMDAAAEARNALAWRDAHARFVVHVAPDTIRALLEEHDVLRTEVERLKRFIELELAKIEPQWTAEGKGGYWWGVKIGLETALAKLCEIEGQAP